MLQKLELQNRTWCVEIFQEWHLKDVLLLSPPYQRGVVWGVKRQRNYIRSLLMGVPVPSVIVNDRLSANFPDASGDSYCVIDGKQRITALLNFFNNRLSIPADWVDVADDIDGYAYFFNMTLAAQRRFSNLPIATAETRIATLEGEKLIFDLINFGGLQQGEHDDDLEVS